MSASWGTSVPKQTINRPNYTSHTPSAILYTRPPHCPEYVLKKNTATKVNSEDLCSICSKQPESCVLAAEENRFIRVWHPVVCAPECPIVSRWTPPKHRGPDGRVRGCAQEAKLPPGDAASLSELLSEVPGQAAPLSSPIEVTLHLYASLLARVDHYTHIGKVLALPQYQSLIQLHLACKSFRVGSLVHMFYFVLLCYQIDF